MAIWEYAVSPRKAVLIYAPNISTSESSPKRLPELSDWFYLCVSTSPLGTELCCHHKKQSHIVYNVGRVHFHVLLARVEQLIWLV